MTLVLPTLAPDHSNLQHILDQIAKGIPAPSATPFFVGGGAKETATAQATTSTTYTTLATPDLVTVALPTKGLIFVGYEALWQNTVASNGRAAIFLNAVQLKTANNGPALAQEATSTATANVDDALHTFPIGLKQLGNTVNATDVTTGQVIGDNNTSTGGPAFIFAAAGTYDVSVKFKNNAAGTLTVKNRHLWVACMAFPS